MQIELRNGTTVDVPDPRDSKHARQFREDKAKYGYWVLEYEDGVPVRMRWHAPAGTADEIAAAVSLIKGEQ